MTLGLAARSRRSARSAHTSAPRVRCCLQAPFSPAFSGGAHAAHTLCPRCTRALGPSLPGGRPAGTPPLPAVLSGSRIARTPDRGDGPCRRLRRVLSSHGEKAEGG